MSYYSLDSVLEIRARAFAEFTCPQCSAPPGHPCLSKKNDKATGKPALRKTAHGPRFDLAVGRTPRDHTISRRREQPLFIP